MTACGVSGDQWEVLPFPHPHNRGAEPTISWTTKDGYALGGISGSWRLKAECEVYVVHVIRSHLTVAYTLSSSNTRMTEQTDEELWTWAVEPRALYTSLGIKRGTSSVTQESWGRLSPKTTAEASGNPSDSRAFYYSVAELDRSRRELRATLLFQCSPDTTQRVVSLNSTVATCTPNMLYLVWGVM